MVQRAALVLISALGLAAPSASTAASFAGLGDLPGGAFGSRAAAVSGDGSVIVGQSIQAQDPDDPDFTGFNVISTGTIGVRWLASGAVETVGIPSSGAQRRSMAWGVSSDGSTTVGRGVSGSLDQPFYSTVASGYQAIPLLFLDLPPGATNSDYFRFGIAHGASADGRVVVGTSGGRAKASGLLDQIEAFRWVNSTGSVGLGDLPGGATQSEAYDVSADGWTIVGRSTSDEGWEAYVWDTTDGMQGLGFLPGDNHYSQANAITPDASVIVGVAGSDPGVLEAVRWDSEGIESLGVLSPGENPPYAMARDVSDDGSWIVGESNTVGGLRAFIWHRAEGMRRLDDVLRELGVGTELDDWTLSYATGISGDGLIIAGVGYNPDGEIEGWMASLAAGAGSGSQPGGVGSAYPAPEPRALVTGLVALSTLAFLVRRRWARTAASVD